MTFQHPADRGGEGRGRFERLAELVSRFTGVAAWQAAGLELEWQLFRPCPSIPKLRHLTAPAPVN